VERDEARRRFGEAAVARLATIRPDGSPHLVPVVFALAGDVAYLPIDHKPKATTRLQRLVNLGHEPRCTLLADHYDDDWSRLWWVRADGHATIVAEPGGDHAGIRHLAGRYPQYRDQLPTGPLIVIRITQWRWWSAI
jgi:PPOX class probable F420-dependent enzyme